MADPSSTCDVHRNEETEIDTLGDSTAKAIAEDHDTTEETDPAAAADQTPKNPIQDFLNYREYNVPNRTIVRRQRETHLQNNSENLMVRQDIRYLGFEWVQRFSWRNDTSADSTYTRAVTEGLTITNGQETERNFGVSASFKGLGVSAGGYTKNFTETETSSLTQLTKTVTVPAGTEVFLYQKQYKFLTEVWFWQRVPAWANYNHFTIGADGTYARVQRTANTAIYAEEYWSLHNELSGSTNITAQGGNTLSGEPTSTRQFTNITAQAKRCLADHWGIRG